MRLTSLTSVLEALSSIPLLNHHKIFNVLDRQILHVVFGEGGLIAVSHGLPKNKNVARLDTKGLVTVWKETNTDQPDK